MSKRFTGSEPDVGSFDCRVTADGDDWGIFIVLKNDERIERYCSTWKGEPGNGLIKVYAILREYGFSLAGFQSAEIIKLNGSTT